MMRKTLLRLGISILSCLSLVPLTSAPVSAKEIVMVVKGTIARDSWDTLGIFQVGNSLEGKTFTLTITFDDAGAVLDPGGGSCAGSMVNGNSANPARAVLRIGKGSYTLGTKPESQWDAYKDTAPNCPGRGVGFHVMEGALPQTSNLWVMAQGPTGKELRGGASWQSPIPPSRVVGFPDLGSFNITRPGDAYHAAWGRLVLESLSISPATANSLAQAGDGEGSAAAAGGAAEPGSAGAATGKGHREQAGGNIVITVKGKVSLGHDDYGIFKLGRNLAGQDFTLVMTFSTAASHRQHMCGEKADGTSYLGTSKDVPAKAVLTIGKGAFVFGAQPDSSWGAFRGVVSECMENKVAFNFKEGTYPQTTLLWVKLQAPEGVSPLNTSIDWNSPFSSANLNKSPLLSSFGISHPGDYEHCDHGVLIPDSVTIDVGNAGEAQPSPGSSAAALDAQGDSQSSSNASVGSPPASGGSSTSQAPAQPQSLKDRFRKAVGGLLPKVTVPNP